MVTSIRSDKPSFDIYSKVDVWTFHFSVVVCLQTNSEKQKELTLAVQAVCLQYCTHELNVNLHRKDELYTELHQTWAEIACLI